MSIAFAEPSRLSAGFYQSLVLSNEVEEAGDGERPSSCVYSFGSNRNSLQAVCRPGVPGNAPSAGRAGGPSPSAARRDGEGAFVAEPTALDLENVVNVVQVSCGGNHSCVLEKRPGEEGGQVWTWGLGNGGRLGVKRPRKASEVQALLKNSKNFDALLADKAYVQWLTSDGKWSLHTPVKLQFGTDRIASISCGTDYTLALTENGAIYAWGIGSYGNLGTGLICDQWTPALVQMPENVRCCQVAAGTKHSMALTTAGSRLACAFGRVPSAHLLRSFVRARRVSHVSQARCSPGATVATGAWATAQPVRPRCDPPGSRWVPKSRRVRRKRMPKKTKGGEFSRVLRSFQEF